MTIEAPTSAKLIFEIQRGNFELAEKLIDQVKDLDEKDLEQETALSYAVMEDQPSLVKKLLEKGVDFENRNWAGQTPLQHARSVEVAELLILAGADINASDRGNRTPLYEFIENRTTNHLALYLLTKEPNLNIKEQKEGNTPLHAAVKKQDLRIVEAILKSNPDLNIRNFGGKTPLGEAHRKDMFLTE